LGQHGPTKAQCVLGSGWAIVSVLWASTTRPENLPGLFGPKHDGLGPCRPDPTQYPALAGTGDGVAQGYGPRKAVWPEKLIGFISFLFLVYSPFIFYFHISSLNSNSNLVLDLKFN
jgi:hypothetical protein